MNEELNMEKECECGECYSDGNAKYTDADILDIIEELTSPIIVDIDELQGVKLDKEQFNEGIKEISFLCGIATGLKGVGFSNSQVYEYIMAREGLLREDIME